MVSTNIRSNLLIWLMLNMLSQWKHFSSMIKQNVSVTYNNHYCINNKFTTNTVRLAMKPFSSQRIFFHTKKLIYRNDSSICYYRHSSTSLEKLHCDDMIQSNAKHSTWFNSRSCHTRHAKRSYNTTRSTMQCNCPLPKWSDAFSSWLSEGIHIDVALVARQPDLEMWPWQVAKVVSIGSPGHGHIWVLAVSSAARPSNSP